MIFFSVKIGKLAKLIKIIYDVYKGNYGIQGGKPC